MYDPNSLSAKYPEILGDEEIIIVIRPISLPDVNISGAWRAKANVGGKTYEISYPYGFSKDSKYLAFEFFIKEMIGKSFIRILRNRMGLKGEED